MSVNAINGVEPQQQPQKSRALPYAVAGGAGLGAVGGITGYLCGGKTPNLDQVFAQAPDTFTDSKVTEKDAEAAKTLQDALTEYKAAGADEKVALRSANIDLNSQINATSVDNQAELQKAIDDAKDAYNKKEVEIDGKKYKSSDISKELKDARAEVEAAKSGDDAAKAAAEEKLKKAKANAQTFNNEAKKEMKAVADAQKAMKAAKKAKFDELAKADGVEKTVKTAAEEAKAKLTEAKSKKLNEIFSREDVKEAFGKIKSVLSKEGKGKMAAIVGGTAALVGLIGGYLMGSNHSENA